MTDDNSTDRSGDSGVPDSLTGSGGQFERSKGVHILPKVSAPADVLPPSAAVTVDPAPQASTVAPPTPSTESNSGK